jgi:hypothetical protein
MNYGTEVVVMDLSNKIISQFVKITNDKEKKEDFTKTYGTVVIQEGQVYVKLDGSDILTPVDTTVQVKDNDRVSVGIRNHNATIEGNFTDISASNEHVTIVDDTLNIFQHKTDVSIADTNERLDDIGANLTNVMDTVDDIVSSRDEYATKEYVNDEITKQQFFKNSPIITHVYMGDFIVLKEGLLDKEITVNGIMDDLEYVVIMSPSSPLENGLFYQACKKSADTINVRFYNQTGRNITTAYRRWNIICFCV